MIDELLGEYTITITKIKINEEEDQIIARMKHEGKCAAICLPFDGYADRCTSRHEDLIWRYFGHGFEILMTQVINQKMDEFRRDSQKIAESSI